MIHGKVEVKNDDKSWVGEENWEPGEDGEEGHDGLKVIRNDTWAGDPQVRLLGCWVDSVMNQEGKGQRREERAENKNKIGTK